MMPPPPPFLDSARVLHYAISRSERFHDMKTTDGDFFCVIAAFAICRYDTSPRVIYLFGCSSDWEVQSDTDFETVDEAMQTAASHAEGQAVEWVAVAPSA